MSIMDRTSTQKTDQETEGLNNTADQMSLMGIHRTLSPTAAEYTFLSSTLGTLTC